MRGRRQLYGLTMRPSAGSLNEYEQIIYSSDLSVKSDFKKEYEKHMAGMEIVAMSAKIYILKNWEKVSDWSNLEISVVDNTKEETYYYKYKERKIKHFKPSAHRIKMLEEMEEERKNNQNPVHKISDVVLDTTDGDFSLDINGKQHFWIDDEAVIVLADYIEGELKYKVKSV